jgi:hypothetical protein
MFVVLLPEVLFCRYAVSHQFGGREELQVAAQANGKNSTLSTVLQNRKSSVIHHDGHRVCGALTRILLSEVRAGVPGSGDPEKV